MTNNIRTPTCVNDMSQIEYSDEEMKVRNDRNTKIIQETARETGEYIEANIKVSDHIRYTSTYARFLTCKHCGKQYGTSHSRAYAIHAGRGYRAILRHMQNEHKIFETPIQGFHIIFDKPDSPVVQAWKEIKAARAETTA